MRIVRYIAFSFVFFLAFACQKEVIEPRHTSDSYGFCGQDDMQEPARFGVNNNGGGVIINGGDDDGGITDPNQDEDQNKKKKNN